MNDELYQMMLSLCPPDWRFIKIEESSATGYLDYLFNTDFSTRWILNLDEDCFLTDYQNIHDLLEFMEKGDYGYCGVQDGGSIPVRIHNPLVSNPFLNLFDSKKILSLQRDYDEKNYSVDKIREKHQDKIRFLETEYKFDMYEEFYKHFFWLLENNLLPYFLKAEEYHKEKYFVISPLFRIIPYFNSPTLVKDHLDRNLAIHTWHSRFINFKNIRKRIINCYNDALGDKQKIANKYEIIKLNS